MKANNPTGYMIMFLETDLKYAKKFNETALSPVQKAVYEKISEAEKEKVRQGGLNLFVLYPKFNPLDDMILIDLI